MRALGDLLLAEQKKSAYDPNPGIVIGVDVYTITRILKFEYTEKCWGGIATILLDNADDALTAKDFRAKTVTFVLGFVGVVETSSPPSLVCYDYQQVSYEGKLAVAVYCIDFWNLMNLLPITNSGGVTISSSTNTWISYFDSGEKVSEYTAVGVATGIKGIVTFVGTFLDAGSSWMFVSCISGGSFTTGNKIVSDDWEDTEVTDIIVGSSLLGGSPPTWRGNKNRWEIVQEILAGYVTFSKDSSDDIFDGSDAKYKPTILTAPGQSIGQIVKDLMGATLTGVRKQNDGKLHFFNVTTPPVTPDYIYDLSLATSLHTFFSDVKSNSELIPNAIYVYALVPAETGLTPYSGYAEDAASVARLGRAYPTVIQITAQSNAECQAIADAFIARMQKTTTRGNLEVPINVGQELWDYPQIVDNRYPTPVTHSGYVTGLQWIYKPGQYRLIITFGELNSAEAIPSSWVQNKPPETQIPVLPPPDSGVMPTPYKIPKAIQGYHHNIIFSSVDQTHIDWTSGTVMFYDGTTLTINEKTGTLTLTGADENFIYFDLDDVNLHDLKCTTNYLSIMSPLIGIVATAQAGSSSGVKADIHYSYGKEPLINTDRILAGVINTALLKVCSSLTGNRIEIDADFLAGYSDATTKEFYIASSDGKAYFGAGGCILDHLGAIFRGSLLRLQDPTGTYEGIVSIGGSTYYYPILLSPPSGGGVMVNAGPLLLPPNGDGIGPASNAEGVLNFRTRALDGTTPVNHTFQPKDDCFGICGGLPSAGGRAWSAGCFYALYSDAALNVWEGYDDLAIISSMKPDKNNPDRMDISTIHPRLLKVPTAEEKAKAKERIRFDAQVEVDKETHDERKQAIFAKAEEEITSMDAKPPMFDINSGLGLFVGSIKALAARVEAIEKKLAK